MRGSIGEIGNIAGGDAIEDLSRLLVISGQSFGSIANRPGAPTMARTGQGQAPRLLRLDPPYLPLWARIRIVDCNAPAMPSGEPSSPSIVLIAKSRSTGDIWTVGVSGSLIASAPALRS